MLHRPPRYVIVTPVRDEARCIRRTIASVASQTLLPCEWVIVDDGSTDGTGEIIDHCALRCGWMTVVHRANRGYRAAGGGVIDAFNAGFRALNCADWNFIAKLDGDLSFAPDYFERCFAMFEAEPQLGIGGGTVCRVEDAHLVVDSAGDPPFHVRGATKIYRRACWDQVAPLAAAPGWDTIDEVMANFHGFRTRTFAELQLTQHKPTGAADGNWRNWVKNGRANYVAGYHPLFMVAKCVKRLFRQRPFFVESAALLTGYTSAWRSGMLHPAGDEVVRFLRRQQVRRLLLQSSIYR